MATNPLLAPIEQLIDYRALKPDHILPAITELLDEHKAHITAITQHAPPLSWRDFIEFLDRVSSRLWRAWNVVCHLNAVSNTPELRAVYHQILPKITDYATSLGLNKKLFLHYEALAKSPAYGNLTATQQRIIELALRDFTLSGVALEGEQKKRYECMAEKTAHLSQKFSENTLDAVDNWAYFATAKQALEGLPEDALLAARAAAQADGKEGYKFTLHMPSYLPVMQYAKNSALREIMYKAYHTLASDQGEPPFDNSDIIEQLLALRQEKASLLGYKNFADMQLTTRMANSTEQVIAFLRDLASKAKPFAQKEVEALKQFAKNELGIPSLNPWDYAYASEQLRQHQYAYSDEEIRQYLPENTVIQGLFRIIQTLYDVHVEPTPLSTWHSDVNTYTLTEKGRLIGHLYLDLYARTGKQSGAWADTERNRHVYGSTTITPIIYVVCNFTPPSTDKPALLSLDDLITLFHEMGHALHALLAKVNEPAVAPFASVELDAIELPSQFMENFIWEWEVIEQLTRHWQNNQPLPRERYEKIRASKHFQSGMQTVRQIEFSLFDMLIHQSPHSLNIKEVLALLNDVRNEVAVVIPPLWDRFPHHFSHLFAGGYSAGYYSYKWAEVLSADAYSVFEENKTAEKSILNANIGKQFKEKILEVGGALPAAEFFEHFRGRPPQADALLRHHGLSESE